MTAIEGFREVVGQVGTIARFELRRHYKSHRLTGILLVLIAIALLVVLFPPLANLIPAEVRCAGIDPSACPDVERIDRVTAIQFFVPFLAAAVALLFGADSLVREFTSNTGHVLLPNPVPRVGVLAGKFTAALAASWATVLVLYAIVVAVAQGPGEMGQALDIPLSLAYALVYTFAVLSVTFLISALAPSVTASVAAVFILFVIFFPWVGLQFDSIPPEGVWNVFVLTEAGKITHRLLDQSIDPDAWTKILVFLAGYSAVSLVAAGGVFSYRES